MSNSITAPVVIVKNAITAPVFIARDAYQIALAELLAIGVLPVDLPTRGEWLDSLVGGIGPTGVQGAPGASIVGPIGLTGPKGDIGLTGNTGAGGTFAELLGSPLDNEALLLEIGAKASREELANELTGKANVADVVMLTGDQTIAGSKTFSDITSTNAHLEWIYAFQVSSTNGNIDSIQTINFGVVASGTMNFGTDVTFTYDNAASVESHRTALGLGTAATRNASGGGDVGAWLTGEEAPVVPASVVVSTESGGPLVPQSFDQFKTTLGITDVPAPLQLNAPPTNYEGITYVHPLFGLGAGSGYLNIQQVSGGQMSLRIYVPTGDYAPPPVADWNPTTRVLEVSINIAATTGNEVKTAIDAVMGGQVICSIDQGDGSAFVAPLDLTAFPDPLRTLASALGQLAIVNNGDGTFSTWQAVRLDPVKWVQVSNDAGGGGSFADLTGAPSDNTALAGALDGKVSTMGDSTIDGTLTLNGLSATDGFFSNGVASAALRLFGSASVTGKVSFDVGVFNLMSYDDSGTPIGSGLSIQSITAYPAILAVTTLTAPRTWAFPDASGNVMITGAPITGTPISGSSGSFTTLAASGVTTMPAGTQANAALQFGGVANTGFYVSSGQLLMEKGGVVGLYLNNSTKTVIPIAAQLDSTLNVTGLATLSGGALSTQLNICQNSANPTDINGTFGSGGGGVFMVADWAIAWNSLTSGASNIFGAGTRDTTLSRKSAGIIRFGTTSSNSLGSLEATNATLLGTLNVTGITTLGALTFGTGANPTIGGASSLGFNLGNIYLGSSAGASHLYASSGGSLSTRANLGYLWAGDNTTANAAADTGIFRKSGAAGTIVIGNGTVNNASGGIETGAITLTGVLTVGGKITANGQGALSALTANDVVTLDILRKEALFSPYFNMLELPAAGWTASSISSGGATTYASVLRLANTTTAGSSINVDSGNLFLSGLGETSINGYSKINWSRTIVADVIIQYAWSASMAGQRILIALGGYEIGVANPFVGTPTGGSYGAVGMLLTMTSATDCEIRLVASGQMTNANQHQINAASNASPIVITTAGAHGLVTGEMVNTKLITGNTAGNGIFTVTVVSPTTFSLNGSVGNADYVSGGRWQKISPVLYTGIVANYLHRYTLVNSGGVLTLYINGTTYGSLNNTVTLTGGFGSFGINVENATGGGVGNSQLYIRPPIRIASF